MLLRYFENLELTEIARCLDISYSAAGAALCRARAKLTHIFAETGTEETVMSAERAGKYSRPPWEELSPGLSDALDRLLNDSVPEALRPARW